MRCVNSIVTVVPGYQIPDTTGAGDAPAPRRKLCTVWHSGGEGGDGSWGLEELGYDPFKEHVIQQDVFMERKKEAL